MDTAATEAVNPNTEKFYFGSDKKPVKLMNTDTVYESIAEAARATGVNKYNLRTTLNRARKTPDAERKCGRDKDGNRLVWDFVNSKDRLIRPS
jgi:hypothetical protein